MTDAEIRQILEENERRNALLFTHYDPLTGEGSLIPREQFWIAPNYRVLIPTYLYNTSVIQEIVKAGSLLQYAEQFGENFNRLLNWFNQQRITFDFEYWAATCSTIRDKLSGKDIPFILNGPQRKILKILTEKLFNNEPVRAILLKARQYGGSTLIDQWEAWIQLFHRVNWNSVIATHEQDASRTIRNMYQLMADNHPREICEVKLRSFQGSPTKKVVPSRGCTISVACIRNPESLRSNDIKLAHLSEVGLWQDNPTIKGDDLAQSIIASVPNVPFTAIVLESTAKGIGTYFYRTWKAAETGKSAFVPIFVAWFEIAMYWERFINEEEKIEFIKTMSAEEFDRWNYGATLEGLQWYRHKLSEMPSEFRMRQEFPSTPQEAFATTGRYVHNPADIDFLRAGCSTPKFVGELIATAQYGKEAIDSSLRFLANGGELYLWAMPDKTLNVRNRYIVTMDIGGRNDDADWTVISVIDRYMLLFGGVEECIGTWRFHLDQDLAVWRAVQLARFFNDALLVVEQNSLDTKGTEGDHSYTILDAIVEHYPNIYYRDDPTKVREGLAPHYGFYTGRAQKMAIVSHMQHLLRDKQVIVRDERLLNECAWFEQKERRDQYGAIEGEHDDIYMSYGIGLYVSSKWDMPIEIEESIVTNKATVMRSHAHI